jgi:hypothetical protein
VEWPDIDADTSLMQQRTCSSVVAVLCACSRIVSVAYRHAELHYQLLLTRPLSRICLWGGDFALKRRKNNFIDCILYRNCLLKHVIEGKIAGTRRRGRRSKQLLDDGKETRRYTKSKEEAPWRNVLWTCSGKGYGYIVRRSDDYDRKFRRKVLKLFSNRHIY